MSMWGRKDQETDARSDEAAQPEVGLTSSPPVARRETAAAPDVLSSPSPESRTSSRMCRSVKFQGEIHCDEDLFVDGTVDGMIDIPNHMLVIGPNSEVRADIQARSLVLHGRLQGKVKIGERIEIKKKGRLDGDLVTHRLVIEDGAVFCGTSEVHPPKVEASAPASAGTKEPSLSSGVKAGTSVQAPRPASGAPAAAKPVTT